MQINSLDKCCKPIRFNTFSGHPSSPEKVRYKHYKQMDDETLSARSILKAHQDVNNSAKMKLYKAMPKISSALTAATIALTQPATLSSRIASGLGFLALSEIFDSFDKSLNKRAEEKQKPRTLAQNLAMPITVIAGAFAIGGLLKANKNSKVVKFLSKEANTLSNEINNSKLGRKVLKKTLKFSTKHPKLTNALSILAPFGSITGSVIAQVELHDSLSKDIKDKADKNYVKAKLIQQLAKEEFDKIDAQEV